MRIIIVFVGVLMLFNSGCNTIRTTFLKQNECGQLVKQPHHFKKGLPVMLEVPTHVDVRIVQSDFWRIVKDQKGNETGLEHIPEATSRSTRIDSVFTEQMFLMDPKRPAEGTGQFKLGFNTIGDDGKGKDNGTLSSVEYKAEDKTLAATADLISAAVGTFKKTSLEESEDLVGNTRTIALKRFGVGTAYEGEIAAFVEQYINGCADKTCYESPTYAQSSSN